MSRSDVEKSSSSVEKVETHIAVQDASIPPGADAPGLKKVLTGRHLSFISIGAAIGTGIFLGIGGALANGGPLGLFLGYAVICSVCASVMLLVGEMVTFLPVAGGHITLAGRFVDPALAPAMALNYYLCWVFILCAEASASAVLVSYWTESINAGVWIAIALVIILLFNIVSAAWYGEGEVWFSSIKVITITGLIILGIIIAAGGGPDGKATGFEFWRNPGPFVQYLDIQGSKGRFLGFFSVMTQASFSLIGTEMLALAAAETKNPRRNIPVALRTVWIRMVIFYICGAFVVGLIVPSNNPRLGAASTAAASPYVIAIERVGIKALPSIINAALITSALSAGCADLYTTSRALYTLALQGHVPRLFSNTNRFGVPWIAVLFSWAIGLLAFLGVGSGSGVVFDFLVNLTALSGVLTWWLIALTYLRFRAGMKKQGISRADLPWRTAFGYPAACWVLLIISIVCIFSGWTVFRPGKWDTKTFFSNYLPVAWLPIFYFAYKFRLKSKIVSAEEMDFVSNIDEIEQEAAWFNAQEKKIPKGVFGRVFGVLF